MNFNITETPFFVILLKLRSYKNPVLARQSLKIVLNILGGSDDFKMTGFLEMGFYVVTFLNNVDFRNISIIFR